ncbi:MAG: sigma-54 dependent transcriptional regulator [Georgfuchsia sp.]
MSSGDIAKSIVAEDSQSIALLDLARRVAASDATVLLVGPTGCGKEVIARYIHAQSKRAARSFIAVNCAAIPDTLLEATLFGAEKGAYTGAVRSQSGKFEQAQKGTLLLDEISEMPLTLQAKLLRVLQERELERVGSSKTIALDVRIIATSNNDMARLVEQGRFRADLYYRLNVFPMQIAALKQRPGDIVALARATLVQLCAAGAQPVPELSPAAVQSLLKYHWPGNVRELQNVMQRTLILSDGACIEAEHLSLPASAKADSVDSSTTATFPLDMKSLERNHILETLATVNWSRKLAVQKLGISERTLRSKLSQYRAEAFN